jgi:Ca2+-binding EF-hand superfamily protein
MPSEQEAIHAIPSDIDINGISNALNDPSQVFRMLDKNNDGRVTKEDLELLLTQFGLNGMAANILSKYLFNQLDANHNGTIEISDLANAGNILWNLFQKKQNSGDF